MHRLKYSMILISFFLIPLAGYSDPVTTTIADTGQGAFWGGAVVNSGATNYGDVIGYPDFSVEKMDVTRDGKNWTVVLTGPYFSNFQNNVGLTPGYAPGDLYIDSLGWTATPDGTTLNYSTDTFSEDEGWGFIVTSNPVGTAVGYGLYTLEADAAHGYQDTNALSGIYRDNQAWRGGADSLVGSATYNLSGNTLTFTFNTGDLFWGDAVGFHWAMMCGNDVVEGEVPAPAPPVVPEPSTLLLLGLGLAGVAAYKKIRS